jgi:N-acetylglucosamine kinase-like BadF-type ATPase
MVDKNEKIKLFSISTDEPEKLVQGGKVNIYAEINYQEYMTEKEMKEFMENINNCIQISQNAALRILKEEYRKTKRLAN